MISWIHGDVVKSWQANNKFYVLINCQGLGYEIQILEHLINDINKNNITEKKITLWLKHIKKEDSDFLFGFISKDQRDFFVKILSIKGIGSQIGMSLLNKFTLNKIIKAVTENDKKLISSVPGIGQKMTDRIILELKENIIINEIEKDDKDECDFLLQNLEIKSILLDIDLTLQSLNYSKKEIKDLFPLLIKDIKNKKISNLDKSFISFENLLKVAMDYLDKNNSNLAQ